MHNIPDDCFNNPLARWNEKRAHPGQVFELAEKGDLDALDHIGEHGVMYTHTLDTNQADESIAELQELRRNLLERILPED